MRAIPLMFCIIKYTDFTPVLLKLFTYFESNKRRFFHRLTLAESVKNKPLKSNEDLMILLQLIVTNLK